MATKDQEISQDDSTQKASNTKINPPTEKPEEKAPETPKKSEAALHVSTPTDEAKSAEPPQTSNPVSHGSNNRPIVTKDQHGVSVYQDDPITEKLSKDGVNNASNLSPFNNPREPHKLQTGWTLHMDRKRKRGINEKDFKSGLKTVSSFTTIEDFYNIWSFVKKPEALPSNVNIYLFRKGLTPAWESFPRGGHWIIKVTKGNGLVDLLWEELVMATLGEQFGTPELVGIALSVRKFYDVLTIWNPDNAGNRGKIRFHLGERLKTILNLHHNTTVEYKDFKGAIETGSTTYKAKQYIYVPQN